MQPSADWALYSSETECLAGRTYGSSANPITLGVRQAPLGNSYELIVGQKGQPPETVLEGFGELKFGTAAVQRLFMHSGSKANQTDIYQVRLTAAEMEEMRSAPDLTMRLKDGPTIRLSLNGMSDLLSKLAACAASLQSRWNIASHGNATLETGARGDVRSLFSADDYPLQAIASRQGGRVQFLVLVDQTGSVAGCDVVISSGNPLLDGMGCQVIRKRARFTPALDLNGKPVRDSILTPPVIWTMK
jgi:TonB family protein